MIFDSLKNLEQYQLLYPSIKVVKLHLEANTIFLQGRKHLDDNNACIGLEYDTKKEEECVYEGHRRFIDLHIILEGEESVHISPIENMSSLESYNEVDDYELFSGNVNATLLLAKGYFLLLNPSDIHKTGIKIATPKLVKKYVYKLPV